MMADALLEHSTCRFVIINVIRWSLVGSALSIQDLYFLLEIRSSLSIFVTSFFSQITVLKVTRESHRGLIVTTESSTNSFASSSHNSRSDSPAIDVTSRYLVERLSIYIAGEVTRASGLTAQTSNVCRAQNQTQRDIMRVTRATWVSTERQKSSSQPRARARAESVFILRVYYANAACARARPHFHVRASSRRL